MKHIKQSSLDFVREYKHRSYFLRNFVLVLLLLLIPFTLIVTLYYNNAKKSIYNDIKSSNYDLLQNIASMSTYILKNSLNVGLNLSVQTPVKYYCYHSTVQSYHSTSEQLFDIIETLELTNELIYSIELYSNETNSYLSESNGISSASTEYNHSLIKNSIRQYKTNPVFFHSVRYNIYPHLITVYVPVMSGTVSQRIIGAVLVHLNFEEIKSLLNLPEDTKYYIFKNDNSLLYSNDLADLENDAQVMSTISSLNLRKNSQVIHGQSLYTYIEGTSLGNSYLLVTSLDNYQDRFSKMPLFFTIYISIAFLLSLAYALLIVNHTSKPITALLNIFSANSELKNYKSEDEFLTCKIVDAIDKNDSLQTLLSQRMTLLHNTQLVALQTQINPHFLYNTLETIKWNAMDLTNGENTVSKSVQDLGQLLRYSLTLTPKYVPFSTEREYLELYLKIVNARFEKPVELQWNLAEAVDKCMIPRLFLQPVLENSIQHGLRSISGEKLITIKAYFCESYLHIKIHDNGIGMNSDEVKSLNEYLTKIDQTAEQHIGLLNLAQRIQISYGNDCYLKVSSEPNIGTTVSIRIHNMQ